MRTTLNVLLAALLVVGMAAPAAASASAASVTGEQHPDRTATVATDESAENDSAANDSSVNVTVGQQLSTVVAATNDEVQTDFEETTFEVEYESANDSERAEAVADRTEEIRERTEDVREDYREATEAYEAGEISRSEYARRLAELNVRAENVLSSLDGVRDRADNLTASELEAAGLNETALRSTADGLDNLTGTGTDALFQRFTGQSEGSVEIETANGLSIEVESEDGERSREFERPGDGDANLTLNRSVALEAALEALSDANWTLDESSTDADDGTYEFEFVRRGGDGEAEVTVDGSSGTVVGLEAEIEDDGDAEGAESDRDEGEREDADESDSESEREDEAESERESDGDLELSASNGSAAPGETVTLRATVGDEPANVTVTANGSVVGVTDADGELSVTVPDDGATYEASEGDAEAELEVEADDDSDDDSTGGHTEDDD